MVEDYDRFGYTISAYQKRGRKRLRQATIARQILGKAPKSKGVTYDADDVKSNPIIAAFKKRQKES